MAKKKDEITIRSSAAEYLTYVASVGDQQDSIEMRYEDENIYASNDIVLIILWILASIKDPGYIPVVVNFLIFFLNDMYGFICWKKRETAQC